MNIYLTVYSIKDADLRSCMLEARSIADKLNLSFVKLKYNNQEYDIYAVWTNPDIDLFIENFKKEE